MAAQAQRMGKGDRQRLTAVELQEQSHDARLTAIEAAIDEMRTVLIQIRAIGRFLAYSWTALGTLAIIVGAVVAVIRLTKGL